MIRKIIHTLSFCSLLSLTNNITVQLESTINLDEIEKNPYTAITINAPAIIISYNTDNNNILLYNSLITNLEKGKQIKTIHNIIDNKKELFNYLEKKNIQFHIEFKMKDGKLIWKLYNVFEKKFIQGKAYEYKPISESLLVRTVLIDVWKALFGDEITPFQCFLVYLDTTPHPDKNEYQTTINFKHPFLSDFNKQLLKTRNNISDLSILQSHPLQSILFVMQNNEFMELTKLNSFGQLQVIGRTKTTLSSPTANEAGLFYIDNRCLYRHYFNKKEKKYKKEKIDRNNDYASVYSITNENKILASRNKKIYEISYELNENNEIIIKKAKKITEDSCISMNMTYDQNDKTIIVSQKINGYYQLAMYDQFNNKKIILTDSPYHKQDPAMSPCGNYIAYVAQNRFGERTIEVINRYSGDIIIVTNEPSEYRFPSWIVR